MKQDGVVGDVGGVLPDNSFLAESREEWRDWLAANHLSCRGIWLVTFKKGGSGQRLPYDDAVEEALCFGWIDSLPRKLDSERTMLYFSPRKKGSKWSALNKERVLRMIEEGRMAPNGLEIVERAKEDGTWSALDRVEALVIPDDLSVAFDGHEGSRVQWDSFPKSARRGILEWIDSAKRPETRQKRIEETASLASQGVRANQWR